MAQFNNCVGDNIHAKKMLTLALVSSLFAVGATAVQAAEMKIGVNKYRSYSS